jgi:hypothetical protein
MGSYDEYKIQARGRAVIFALQSYSNRAQFGWQDYAGVGREIERLNGETSKRSNG